MNWDRPVRFVRVKRYPQGIYVDECCASRVKQIDALPDTFTSWCCCMHGTYPFGGVEFISKLLKTELEEMFGKLDKHLWNDRGEYKGYSARVICGCSEEVRERARQHFGVYDKASGQWVMPKEIENGKGIKV